MPLQVSITSSVILNGELSARNIGTNENECRCIRCGISIEKSKSVFVNIQPPVFQPKKNCSSMSMEILSKSSDSNASLESITKTSCVEYCLPKSLHVCDTSETEEDLKCCSQDESNTTISSILNFDSSEEEDRPSIDISVVGSQQSLTPNGQFLQPPAPNVDFKEGLVSQPCTDCHVAVLNEIAEQEESDHEYISLMLQVAHLSPPRKSVGCQTDGSPSRSDLGVAVNILEIYPKIYTKCGKITFSIVSLTRFYKYLQRTCVWKVEYYI
ncbi:hypothetical protein AVEN_197033-1 [Araneus ventricosus]|nr:hypothetical protein AVEN_197033-1 [Araneus ventricosus]